ncbi:hypothetical protein ASPZODRAFT_1795047 [Penicilliopsis zonata CBS 506.65]|uniref:F-box domain-containing protein n=1 Tax=Penicilliopsis zonata CBS 506.65 TaxID=1073090 RepID=A0A1L9SLA4_9EURO|nr:hypothetical protein ASPZODRAFT_1795047 [Penicilliopsis zonata CBS 506.65]OJJ47864.1 hypothetical protein ASPZODRAFT_1795047 [Penicilliopsis zonata CBS 506.65]
MSAEPADARPDGHESRAELSDLPRDIFWMLLSYLDPWDIVRCRRVSRSWNDAFRNPDNLVAVVKRFFPRAKEVRNLQGEGGLDPDWRAIFDRLACRYYHLARAKPRTIKKYRLCHPYGTSGDREWFPVQPWEYHASHACQRVDEPLPEGFWTYEDGLVVYPSADHRCLVLLDLETDQKTIVPFLTAGKVVRRVRLQQKVLVVEWAEPKAFHWLNDVDGVHRHFASSFDVVRGSSGWKIVFRNEWKIMFLGHPLSERDRFFSSHSKTHYIIYIWQPNRSLYTADEDAPIESLFVWDISQPSSYRPSLDPTGRLKEEEKTDGPSIISRFGFRELGFYSVRQRGLPGVQRLDITDDALHVEITENICDSPVDYSIWPAGLTSQVHTTSIPILGEGPCWRRDPGVKFPPYRGSGSLQTSPLTANETAQRWYTVVSQAVDDEAGVRFCLYNPRAPWQDDLDLTLSIETPFSTIILQQALKIFPFGKISGSERFLVGQGADNELLILRFD